MAENAYDVQKHHNSTNIHVIATLVFFLGPIYDYYSEL